jgi:DNA mismatch repair protein MutS2
VRELDLRGCRVEEAIEKLDAYLDKASLGRLHQVRIVHGKGTGVLKREVEKYLKGHPLVASFRTGELAEGSWGVTVANLGPGA